MTEPIVDSGLLARQQANARSLRRRAKEQARRIALAKGHDLGPFYRTGGGDQAMSGATCRRCRRGVNIPDRTLEASGLGILSAQCGDNIAIDEGRYRLRRIS